MELILRLFALKKAAHLCVDVNALLTEEPQTSLCISVHTHQRRLQLEIRFLPNREPAWPIGYCQM